MRRRWARAADADGPNRSCAGTGCSRAAAARRMSSGVTAATSSGRRLEAAHALGLDVQDERQVLPGDGLEVGGLVDPGVGVPFAAHGVDAAHHVRIREALGGAEGHVLHEVGEPRGPGALVAAPHLVEDLRVDNRQRGVFQDHHAQAVGSRSTTAPSSRPAERGAAARRKAASSRDARRMRFPSGGVRSLAPRDGSVRCVAPPGEIVFRHALRVQSAAWGCRFSRITCPRIWRERSSRTRRLRARRI